MKEARENENREEATILNQYRVAAMATVSLKEILNMFTMTGNKILESPYCITQMLASASNGEKNEPYVDNGNYGIKVYRDSRINTFACDYNVKIKEGIVENPLDKAGCNMVLSNLNDAGLEDAPVDHLRLLLHDSEIGKLKGIEDDLFHATLISEKCEDKERNIVADYKINEHLIKNSGFQYRVLNCRELISRQEELDENVENYLISWRGKTAISLNSPTKIAQLLARKHFRNYRMIKTYGTGQEEQLVLLGVGR